MDTRHWHIEMLHHIRDTTYSEDASQVRTGNGPEVMASLRNLAIAIFKLTGTRKHRGRLPPPCPGRHQGPGHTRTCPVMPKTDMTPLC